MKTKIERIDISDMLLEKNNLKTYPSVIIEFTDVSLPAIKLSDVTITTSVNKKALIVTFIETFSRRTILTLYTQLWPNERIKCEANKIILTRNIV